MTTNNSSQETTYYSRGWSFHMWLLSEWVHLLCSATVEILQPLFVLLVIVVLVWLLTAIHRVRRPVVPIRVVLPPPTPVLAVRFGCNYIRHFSNSVISRVKIRDSNVTVYCHSNELEINAFKCTASCVIL